MNRRDEPSMSHMRRDSRVKLSTSACRLIESPQAAHSSRSASWLYCSGTISFMSRAPESAREFISRMTIPVLPLLAMPYISLSINILR